MILWASLNFIGRDKEDDEKIQAKVIEKPIMSMKMRGCC